MYISILFSHLNKNLQYLSNTMEAQAQTIMLNISANEDNLGYSTLKSLLESHKPEKVHGLDFSLKFNQEACINSLQINLHHIHEMVSLEELKTLLSKIESSSTKENFILLTFDSEITSQARKFGFKSASWLAAQNKVLLRELTWDFLKSSKGASELFSTVENITLYLANGGKGSQDAYLKDVWERYLQVTTDPKFYQRLFQKNTAILVKGSNSKSLEPYEETRSVPISYYSLKIDSKYEK